MKLPLTTLQIVLLSHLVMPTAYGMYSTDVVVSEPDAKAKKQKKEFYRCIKSIGKSSMNDDQKINAFTECLDHFGPSKKLYAKVGKTDDFSANVACEAQVLATGKVVTKTLVEGCEKGYFSVTLVFVDEESQEIHREEVQERQLDSNSVNFEDEFSLPPSVAKRVSKLKIFPSLRIHNINCLVM